MKYTFSISCFILLSACAAKKIIPGAEQVMIVSELPKQECEFLGEVVGSQGNWWTDDVTSTKNKMIGARNEMRNQAYNVGANLVLIMESRNTQSAVSFDIKDVTVIGNAYKCKDV